MSHWKINNQMTGAKYMDPLSYIAIGVVGALVAGVLLVNGPDAAVWGAIIGTIASCFFMIGVIAQGVRVGLEK